MTIPLTTELGTQWSVLAQDIDSGEVLFSHNPEQVLSTASIGKIFLLHRLLTEVDQGSRALTDRATKLPYEFIDESGLWHQLQQSDLSLYDIATLIGATSDNYATNTLTRVIGLETVQAHTRELGYEKSALHDVIRWPIPPGKPPRLSEGNATELVRFMSRLALGLDLSASSCDILTRWLTAGCDLSMVAAPFNLDPLAHYYYDRDIWFYSKTGTLGSVRADAGVIMSKTRRVAFAAIANWEPGKDNRDAVLKNMAELGLLIKTHLHAA